MFEVKEVVSKRDLKRFVKFPFMLYKNDPFWIPPLIKDEIKQLSPDKNPAFKVCEAKFWTLWNNGTCVGRVGGIINHDYNKKTGKKFGRFTRIEFIDDTEVVDKLFYTAENWLQEKGMEIVHGPLGFNNLDNQGMLIEGFDYLPSVASVYHKPYYKGHLERLGYVKENDWVEFRLTLGDIAQKKAVRGAEIVKKRYGFDVIKFATIDELRKKVCAIFDILNSAFHELPYVTPFNDEMIDLYTKKYEKIIDPRFVRFIKKDEKVIAFILGMPSLSKAMQKANGKLFPFGIIHIIRALRHPEEIDLLLTGVLPEYQSAGAAVVLFAELQEEMLKHGIIFMETTGIFETNQNVISNWKNYDNIQHKRRRCFVKSLGD